MGTTITTKYSTGDMVYIIQPSFRNVDVPCPKCKGLPVAENEVGVEFHCPFCEGRGVERDRKRIWWVFPQDEDDVEYTVRRITICLDEYDDSQVEYEVGNEEDVRQYVGEYQVFSTREEAQKEADTRNKKEG